MLSDAHVLDATEHATVVKVVKAVLCIFHHQDNTQMGIRASTSSMAVVASIR